MPVALHLPIYGPAGGPYIDRVRVYKRVDAHTYTMLSEEPLGASIYTDSAGVLNDEYYITFYSSTLAIESLPSNVYRVGTHWMQGMGVILELDTTSTHPSVTSVAIYRRRYATTNAIRLDLVPLGTVYYHDPAGLPGDEYHTTFVDNVSLSESQPGPSVIADAEAGTIVVSGTFKDVRNTSITQGPGARDPFGAAPRVEVELKWTKRHRAPTANGQTIIRTHYESDVKRSGVWSVPLIPNDLILGLDSYYEFTFSDGSKYFKRVHTVNGSAQNFAMLIEVNPLDLR